MKMYILVRENVPSSFVPVVAAHASLACYLKFKSHPDMEKWLEESFKKVVCTVGEKEFANAKDVEDNVVMTESALGGVEVGVAFRPREEYPKMFKYFQMYRERC